MHVLFNRIAIDRLLNYIPFPIGVRLDSELNPSLTYSMLLQFLKGHGHPLVRVPLLSPICMFLTICRLPYNMLVNIQVYSRCSTHFGYRGT